MVALKVDNPLRQTCVSVSFEFPMDTCLLQDMKEKEFVAGRKVPVRQRQVHKQHTNEAAREGILPIVVAECLLLFNAFIHLIHSVTHLRALLAGKPEVGQSRKIQFVLNLNESFNIYIYIYIYMCLNACVWC